MEGPKKYDNIEFHDYINSGIYMLRISLMVQKDTKQ